MKHIQILTLLSISLFNFTHIDNTYAANNSKFKNDGIEYKIEDYDTFNLNGTGKCSYIKKRNYALQVFMDLPTNGIIEVFLDNDKITDIYIGPKYLTYRDIFQKSMHRENNFKNSFIFYPDSYILKGESYKFLVNQVESRINIEYSNFNNIEEVLDNTITRLDRSIDIDIKNKIPSMAILQKNYQNKIIEEKIKLKKGENKLVIDKDYDYLAVILYYKNKNSSYEYKKEIIKNKTSC